MIYIISTKRVTIVFSNYYYLGEWTRENDVKDDLSIIIMDKYLRDNLQDMISQYNDLKVSKIVISKHIFLDVTLTNLIIDKFNFNVTNKKIDEAFQIFEENI